MVYHHADLPHCSTPCRSCWTTPSCTPTGAQHPRQHQQRRRALAWTSSSCCCHRWANASSSACTACFVLYANDSLTRKPVQQQPTASPPGLEWLGSQAHMHAAGYAHQASALPGHSARDACQPHPCPAARWPRAAPPAPQISTSWRQTCCRGWPRARQGCLLKPLLQLLLSSQQHQRLHQQPRHHPHPHRQARASPCHHRSHAQRSQPRRTSQQAAAVPVLQLVAAARGVLQGRAHPSWTHSKRASRASRQLTCSGERQRHCTIAASNAIAAGCFHDMQGRACDVIMPGASCHTQLHNVLGLCWSRNLRP